jgi:ABC-type polysaccharide/polyol phosphate transport system ATPase subunit
MNLVVPSKRALETSEQPNATDFVIRVSGVGKTYSTVGAGPTKNQPLNDLITLLRQLFGVLPTGDHGHAALRDISFTLPRGAIIGVIGSNGSGKSTLLKVISRVTAPTNGTIEINGRVVSLLELGLGFRDDLTGRENALLNAALFGLSRRDARNRLDAILEFSGIGEFFDMPLRTYSSGMYLRLSFATAVHMDPSIILADEILAVGDYRFRTKCLNHLLRLKHEGCSILYVSHDMDEIRRLCDSVLWLAQGKVVRFGETDEVVSQFEMAETGTDISLGDKPPVISLVEGTGAELAIESFRLLNRRMQETSIIKFSERSHFEIVVVAKQPIQAIFPRIDVFSGDRHVACLAPLDWLEVNRAGRIYVSVFLPRYLFSAGPLTARVLVEALWSGVHARAEGSEPIELNAVVAPEYERPPHLFSQPEIGHIHPVFFLNKCEWSVLVNPTRLLSSDAPGDG